MSNKIMTVTEFNRTLSKVCLLPTEAWYDLFGLKYKRFVENTLLPKPDYLNDGQGKIWTVQRTLKSLSYCPSDLNNDGKIGSKEQTFIAEYSYENLESMSVEQFFEVHPELLTA